MTGVQTCALPIYCLHLQRNKVSTLIKQAKYNYYDKLISNQADSRKLWNTINNACGRKSTSPSFPVKLKADSEIITHHTEIANYINNYFTNIGKNLADKIPSVPEIPVNAKDCPSFYFQLVDKNRVLTELKNLNENKSEGLDLIPARLVKQSATYLCQPLTHIINLIIKSGVIPNELKVAKILPFYKNKGDKLLCSNYRPISILPVYSKILEKIICKQLNEHLNLHKILSVSQFGFQQKKGAQDALFKFSDQSFKALNDSLVILGIFIDFSKAFDTINHNILLQKLRDYNFDSHSISLIQNYLTNRTQHVIIENSISNSLHITCGVPQGSILGPVLFLLYINDLATHCPLFDTILFADDTNLFWKSKDLNADIGNINSSLNKVNNWCIANKLTLNLTKTNYIIVKNYQKNFVLNSTIHIDNIPLSPSSEIKFLGVVIDTNLNWCAHINSLRTQLNKVTGMIYLASKFLPYKALILLYNSLINSKLTYCLEAWGNAPKTHLNKLLLIQKRIIRIIFHKSPTEHTSPLFIKAEILPIDLLYIYRLCLLGHSAYYTPSHTKQPPTYLTRHSELSLPLPLSTSAAGHRQVSYQMSSNWNKLPLTLRHHQSFATFKILLKKHLLKSLT